MVKTNFPLQIPGIDVELVDLFRDRATLSEQLEQFADLYDQRPFENTGGIKFDSAFAYYYFLKRMMPEVVIESGFWRGFSTWLIDAMLPNIELYCLDPVLMMPVNLESCYRSPRANYSTQDFSCFGFGLDPSVRTCAIFDDHQNVAPRIEQCLRYGIQDVLLDDNQYEETYHLSITHLIKHNDPILPDLFSWIDEYYVFPPIVPVEIEGCPLAPLWDEVPSRLKHLDRNEHFVYSWVTYLRLKPQFTV
ncbi:hypothetical protein LEP3755_39000 [Leptolyngbya sp. NIES-3755]|nr:hypothetical protein LEP3755_39000 [Leptolyngbya sp. NIES-3755]